MLKDVPSLERTYTPARLPPPLSQPCHSACLATNPDTVRYLAFTSGTTGTPKCVMHSDNTLLANAARHGARLEPWPAHAPADACRPLSHHIAWVARGAVAGRRLHARHRRSAAGHGALDWIVETGATYVMGVPTHAMDMLAEQQKRGLARLGKVEVFYMAGSPIPPTVAEAFVAQGIKPQNIYGMTENSSHQYTHPDRRHRHHRRRPAAAADRATRSGCSIRPTRTARCRRATVGEIGGRGAALMLGYFDNQAATEASFNAAAGSCPAIWACSMPSGNLQIVGRLKDLIIRGGHNIYPAHIEALALRNPAVGRVRRLPGRRRAARRAGVHRRHRRRMQPDELLAHLGRRRALQVRHAGVFHAGRRVSADRSGKILKRELVEMVKRGELEPAPVRYSSKQEVA